MSVQPRKMRTVSSYANGSRIIVCRSLTSHRLGCPSARLHPQHHAPMSRPSRRHVHPLCRVTPTIPRKIQSSAPTGPPAQVHRCRPGATRRAQILVASRRGHVLMVNITPPPAVPATATVHSDHAAAKHHPWAVQLVQRDQCPGMNSHLQASRPLMLLG